MIVVPIGPPQCGKSTFCRELQTRGYVVRSFAQPLYDMLAVLVGEEKIEKLRAENRKEESLDELEGKTLRYALQTLGTEWGRHLIDENLWCNRVFRDSPPLLTIDDLRFPNEYAVAKARGATFVRLKPREWRGVDHAHESESYHKEFQADYSIEWESLDGLRRATRESLGA